jgi:GT2 family glycosyltransferase
MSEPFPLVSVVIPTRNRVEKLIRLIKSIYSSDYPNLEVIVVDDCSYNGTTSIIKASYPKIHVIKNDKRKLLAASRNKGFQISKGKFIFFIDDDNVVEPNTIGELVRYMELNENVAIAGPLMLYFGEPNRIMLAGVKRSMLTSKTKFIGRGEIDAGQYKLPIESLDLPNAFMIRRKIFEEIRGFNEIDFPIDYDEADIGEKIRKIGYKIMVFPTARVYHEGPFTRPPAFNDSLRVYYAMRSRIRFHQKYGKRSCFIAFLIIFLPFFILYNSIIGKAYPTLKGLVDGLCGRTTFIERDLKEE